jgi:hypothetical protein
MTVNSLTGEMEKNPSGDRRLFGGSMTAEIPGAFIDVSQIRQIPDSQEVFVDMESNHSIVIELLEMDSTSENENPSRFHFEQLAIDNDASDFSRIHLSKKINIDEFSAARLSSEAQMWIVIGTQLISKFHHRTPRDIVNIYLALIRLPQCASTFLFR